MEVRKNLVEGKCRTCGKSFTHRSDRAGTFCSRPCVRVGDWDKRGRKSIGDTVKAPNGYMFEVVSDDHPYAYKLNKKSCHKVVLQHRVVMERQIGRYLDPRERVHHRNGKRDDNRPENLELWTLDHKDPPGIRMSDAEEHCRTCSCFKASRIE